MSTDKTPDQQALDLLRSMDKNQRELLDLARPRVDPPAPEPAPAPGGGVPVKDDAPPPPPPTEPPAPAPAPKKRGFLETFLGRDE